MEVMDVFGEIGRWEWKWDFVLEWLVEKGIGWDV